MTNSYTWGCRSVSLICITININITYIYFACLFIWCLYSQGTWTWCLLNSLSMTCPASSLLPPALNPIEQSSAILSFLLAFRPGLGIPQPRDLHLLKLFRNPSQYSPSQQSEVGPPGWLGWCSSGGTCIWGGKYQWAWVAVFNQQSCKPESFLKMPQQKWF